MSSPRRDGVAITGLHRSAIAGTPLAAVVAAAGKWDRVVVVISSEPSADARALADVLFTQGGTVVDAAGEPAERRRVSDPQIPQWEERRGRTDARPGDLDT